MKFTYGIDVSQWDGLIDWPTLKNQGFAFVFIRASVGLTADATFKTNWQSAKDVGFLRGAYHFFLEDPDATAQAQTLIDLLSSDPGELPPAVDVEKNAYWDFTAGKQVIVDFKNPSTYLAHLLVVLNTIQTHLQRTPFIYTGPDVWQGITTSAGGAPAWAAGFPLWIANYPFSLYAGEVSLLSASDLQWLFNDIEGGSKYRGFPLLPPGFSAWKLWQFSAEKYKLDGLGDHKSDLDVYPGTEEELRAWAGISTGSQPPDEAGKTLPKITNQAMINAFFRAFGEADYWNIITAAGLESMAVPDSNRQLMYAGPAIEDLPLSADQKQALKNALP
jgi:GH25 family lysozyme M1 (1,4-beta-N-acetylmuramidase)